MAKGTPSKELITKAILQIFPNSFIDADGKTIRIPTSCEGEPIEIKVALTAAKDLVGGQTSYSTPATQVCPQNTEMTEEEIAEVKRLIESLGL